MSRTPSPASEPSAPEADHYEPFSSSAFQQHVVQLSADWSSLPSEARFRCRVEPHHANMAGLAHGGFLMALVDMVSGQGAKRMLDGMPRMVTVSTNIDFLGPAEIGDVLDATVTVDRATSSTVFVSVRIDGPKGVVVKASGVFVIRARR